MRSSRWCLLAAIAAIGLVSACTVPGPPASSDGGNATKGTLVLDEWNNPGALTATKKINEIFEKEHPGVTVKIQSAPTADNAWATLTNSLLASKSVDLLAQFAPAQGKFPPSYTKSKPADTAALIDANQLMDLSTQPFMKRYDQSMEKWAIGHNGKIYGVMAAEYAHNGGVWYKKSLLDKYHMKVPTTYDQFISECKTFESHDITPIFLSGKDNIQKTIWDGLTFQLIMQGHPASQAAQVSSERARAFWDGKQGWDDPVYHEVGQKYQEIMKYIEPAAGGVTEYTAPGIWAAQTEEFPFLVDGSFDYATIHEANPALDVGFFTIPGANNPKDNRVILAPDLTWTVPVWAPHRKLALEWIDTFSRPENYKIWLKETGSLSTQPGVTAPGNDWMSWLNAHMKTAFPDLTAPFTSPGAATEAQGPDTTKVKPIGDQDIDSALKESEKAYRRSAG